MTSINLTAALAAATNTGAAPLLSPTGTITIDQSATLDVSGPVAATTTIDLVAGTPQTLILEAPTQFAGTIIDLAVGDEIILRNTGTAGGNAVVAATIGTLEGTQTLQVLESPDNNPLSGTTGTLDIPIAGAAGNVALAGDYVHVAYSPDATDTVLTVTAGNPVAASIAATTAQQVYGVTGAGVRIGIISDSFNALGGEAADIAAGLLPADVTILSDDPSGTDEGRLMAQIVHDVAPGAAIDFASGDASPEGFADAVAALQQAGCEIIVDDLAFFGTDPSTGKPVNASNGVIDTAINTAVDDGVTYVTTADNYRTVDQPIFGHAADPLALTVAAMNILATPSSVGGYITPQTEFFSSTGSSGKPNITGPDGVPDSFALFPQSDADPAFGTSVAAPAVAAVAALMMQENPLLETQPLTVDQLLELSATSFGEPANKMGAGLVDAEGAVALAASYAVCYRRGTHILTDRGEVAAEHLAIGDKLTNRAGRARAVRWIGRRSYAPRFAAANPDVVPVLIRADAIEDGVPRRDLYVSPRHALYLDKILIPAAALINDATILQPPVRERIDYFHLELATHDVIFAEGAMAESYLDAGNRHIFHNAAEYRAPKSHVPVGSRRDYAPRLEQGPVVDAAWSRLAARAEALGHTLPRRHAITLRGIGVTCVALPAGVTELHLLSPSGLAEGDRRHLGALVVGLRLNGAALGVQDRRLRRGFHPVERHGKRPVRWSSGKGVIAIAPAEYEQRLEIEVAAVIGAAATA